MVFLRAKHNGNHPPLVIHSIRLPPLGCYIFLSMKQLISLCSVSSSASLLRVLQTIKKGQVTRMTFDQFNVILLLIDTIPIRIPDSENTASVHLETQQHLCAATASGLHLSPPPPPPRGVALPVALHVVCSTLTDYPLSAIHDT